MRRQFEFGYTLAITGVMFAILMLAQSCSKQDSFSHFVSAPNMTVGNLSFVIARD